jgi:syntaxin 5
VAKRKALFDDKPIEIAELTFVIKQDLSAINSQISSLQTFVRQQAAAGSARSQSSSSSEEHSKNVVVMLQGKLADVSVGFKEVLEVRTKNIQASRARTEKFVSGVRPVSPPRLLASGSGSSSSLSHSPLYSTPSASPHPPGGDLLTLDPPIGSQSAQQLALMEEGAGGQGTYIQARGEAIEAIERTITELGGIFGQLAQMVGEQKEMIQRIDYETEDVVANVEGGQRELMKYFARVSSNRWLVAKMFGVLMIFFLLWVLVS